MGCNFGFLASTVDGGVDFGFSSIGGWIIKDGKITVVTFIWEF